MTRETLASNSMNRETEIRKLPHSSMIKLSQILEESSSWKQLMASIKREDEPGIAKYSLSDINLVEQHARNNSKTGAEVLFDEWGTSGRKRPSLGLLQDLLVQEEMLRASHYLASEILGVPCPREVSLQHPSPPLLRSVTSNRPELPKPLPAASPLNNMPEYHLSTASVEELLFTVPANSDSHKPIQLAYSELDKVCRWREGNSTLLGSGAFSRVYLAKLPQGNSIAVKQLQKECFNIDGQFSTELEALSRYRHPNLVQLLGFSCNGPSYCLVYEYVSNGSLQERLACEVKPFWEVPSSEPLLWDVRLRIAKGVARGLVHLHTAFQTPLIHRDVKSANILLDANFTAKLGDFGLVRLGGMHNNSGLGETSTKTVIGTSVYMSPESQDGEISVLVDSFSYGVVLLEILTSLESLDQDRETWDLITHTQQQCGELGISPLLDMRAGDWGSPSHHVAHSLYEIAKQCLEDKDTRPTMEHVLTLLQTKVVSDQALRGPSSNN